MARKNIRNFCIVAHIDHGKSTLSDRMLELTDSVDKRTMTDQVLDNMELEKERGITIKARAVTMRYKADDGETYEFNLIDTPGHVDLPTRSAAVWPPARARCWWWTPPRAWRPRRWPTPTGAGARSGVVPILNKIDLPSAHPDEVAQEVEDVIGLPCMDAPRVSAKTGLDVDQVLERVVRDIPAPPATRMLPQSPDLSIHLRQLQGRYRLHPRVRGHRQARRHHQDDGHRGRVHAGGGGPHGCHSA